MIKIPRFLLVILVVGIIFFLLPSLPRTLIDVESGMIPKDLQLMLPFSSQIFAPFLDLPFYFTTFLQPRNQLISWCVWLTFLWLIFSIIKIKGSLFEKSYQILRGWVVTITLFILFISYSILVPLPQSRLQGKNTDEIFVDLHSHSLYSHDGLVTPTRNLNWHLAAGYKAWAITEHNWLGCTPNIQEKLIKKEFLDAVVIRGEEISFQGVHLNLLGLEKDFDHSKYTNIKRVIRDVHSQKGAVIVPHYWAEKKSPFSMEDLYEAGVDGFEVSGDASVPLTTKFQKDIISFCKKKGLVMVSGSNWHGWRNFTLCWTGLKVDGWEDMDFKSREREVINSLRKRDNTRFRVVSYQPHQLSEASLKFEPFIGLFYYFSSLTPLQKISWIFWIIFIYFLVRHLKFKKLSAGIFWFLVTLLLLVERYSLLRIWGVVGTLNKIIPEVAKYLMVLSGITLLLGLTNLKNLRKKRR